MISPASFNFYQELLEDLDKTSGCKELSDETLTSTMSVMLKFSEGEQE